MIALDVMGGDHAPQAILIGAFNAARSGIPVKLFGPQEVITAALDALDASWRQYPLIIAQAPDLIEMDEEPVSAVRKKVNSSLVKAVESVRDGQCGAVISAGNSGALMVAAMLILGRLPGIERPAIAGFLPALNGPVVALDLGANTECRAYHLLQFAEMGAVYATQALQKNNPRIGLLANGQEDRKGSVLTKEAFALLKSSSLNFIGNVEPHDIFMNKVDVVVSDGFSGNIFLKTMESVVELLIKLFKDEFFLLDASSVGGFDQKIVDQIIENIAKKMNNMGKIGGLLLGVKGSAIVCHGNSDASAIEDTLRFAYSQVLASQALESSKKSLEIAPSQL